MKRIYVAGAYNAPNVIGVLSNMRRGIQVATAFLLKGHAPFTPWLDFQFGLQAEISVESYKAYSMAWLEVADCVYVVEGWENSGGTIAEIARARELNIPVFFDLWDFIEWTEEGF